MIIKKLFQKTFHSEVFLPHLFLIKSLRLFAKVEGIIEWDSKKFINWLKKIK